MQRNEANVRKCDGSKVSKCSRGKLLGAQYSEVANTSDETEGVKHGKYVSINSSSKTISTIGKTRKRTDILFRGTCHFSRECQVAKYCQGGKIQKIPPTGYID